MGQAKRSRWRYLTRRREALARILAIEVMGDDSESEIANISEVSAFDVHAARELARSLIALEAEQAVFEDWTRERGLGPENRSPSAFVGPARETSVTVQGCAPGAYVLNIGGMSVSVRADDRTTGEQLAHGLAVALGEQFPEQGATAEGSTVTFGRKRSGGWPGKLAREWRGDSRAPMGRTLAKLGRDLLAALEGQPSECQGKHGYVSATGVHYRTSHTTPVPCPDCHGTGHNLRGVLPAVEVSAVVRRAVLDAHDARAPHHETPGPCWKLATRNARGFSRESWPGSLDGRHLTRVVPRGQHRATQYVSDGSPTMANIRAWAWLGHLPAQCRGPGWVRLFERETSRLPRWRRGELRHAQQRRERLAAQLEESVAVSLGVPVSMVRGEQRTRTR